MKVTNGGDDDGSVGVGGVGEGGRCVGWREVVQEMEEEGEEEEELWHWEELAIVALVEGCTWVLRHSVYSVLVISSNVGRRMRNVALFLGKTMDKW